ncbi:MAG: alpha-L-fucosidase [Sporolactobacillus sp.]|jgi:alpha-L-fucosidase|nr:alpha-L-fucosidase [Sporolactobacillus sp.]
MKVSEITRIRPSGRQINWQKMEFYGFIHFGMNTMTDREWGLGHESPALFNPGHLDTDQWAAVLKSAGMTGAILTCKHHDGFCLWPSRYSEYTVAHSPWKNGKGDVVGEFATSCRKFGLKFGIYLSPWDRTESSYGSGKKYDDFYIQQLTELLTDYGEIFEVWLDGANGEGPNGRKQYYDWNRYYAVIRKLQPNAVISVCGPDVRWIGNEAGHTRPNEWSVVPEALKDVEKIIDKSQKKDDQRFARSFSSADDDLGSRSALQNYSGTLIWYPAEVNTSIRPGWFYHPSEDAAVKSARELFDLYKKSVGGNATLLLNVPPNRWGLISAVDQQQLKLLGGYIRKIKSSNYFVDGRLTFSSNPNQVGGRSILDLSDHRSYWKSAVNDTRPFIEVKMNRARTINTLILKEKIEIGQRIEQCVLFAAADGAWRQIAEVGSVGYQRIISIAPIKAMKIRLEIPKYREYPTLSGLSALYLMP